VGLHHPHGRVVRRLKRISRAHSISEEGKFGSTHSGAGGVGGAQASVGSGQRSGKNSRKSRSGLGRGLPKKGEKSNGQHWLKQIACSGGAGGKGTWGKPGCELEPAWVDQNDPNYESDPGEATEHQKASHGSGNGHGHNTQLKALVPEMSEEDIRKNVEQLVLEYFESNDASEVVVSLQEMLMNLGSCRWMVVSVLVELALDHKPSHREMASQLIADLYGPVVSQRDIGKAFDYLLRQLPDLILDTPDAPALLGKFLARAIADDCIPPKFLAAYKGHVEKEEAKKALRQADTLLSMKHGLVRLDAVWGVGGGVRPVKYLVRQIVMLLKEYLCSGDIQEATLCLKELEVPHFHHELVYEAVVMVIEDMRQKTEEDVCKLLVSLFRAFIITIDQMRNVGQIYRDQLPHTVLLGLRTRVRGHAGDSLGRSGSLHRAGALRKPLPRLGRDHRRADEEDADEGQEEVHLRGRRWQGQMVNFTIKERKKKMGL